GSYSRVKSLISVVLPAPFCPTSATDCPRGTKKLMLRSAHFSPCPFAPGADGYLNPTLSKRIPASPVAGTGRSGGAFGASADTGIDRYSNKFDIYNVSS